MFCFDFNLHISQWASTPGEKCKWWLEAIISLSFANGFRMKESDEWFQCPSFPPPHPLPAPPHKDLFSSSPAPRLSLSLSALTTQRVTDVTQHTLCPLVKVDMTSMTKNERKWKSAGVVETDEPNLHFIAGLPTCMQSSMTSMVSSQIIKRSVIREGDQRIVLNQLQLDHITWEQLHYQRPSKGSHPHWLAGKTL